MQAPDHDVFICAHPTCAWRRCTCSPAALCPSAALPPPRPSSRASSTVGMCSRNLWRGKSTRMSSTSSPRWVPGLLLFVHLAGKGNINPKIPAQEGYTKQHREATEALLKCFVDEMVDGIAASRGLDRRAVSGPAAQTPVHGTCTSAS